MHPRTEFHITEKFNEKRGRETHKGSLRSFSMVNQGSLCSEGSIGGHGAPCPLFIGEDTEAQRGEVTYIASSSSSTTQQPPPRTCYQAPHHSCFSFSAYPVKSLHILVQGSLISGATLDITDKMEAQPQPPLLILQARHWDEGVRPCDSDLLFPFFGWVGWKEC